VVGVWTGVQALPLGKAFFVPAMLVVVDDALLKHSDRGRSQTC
jgi:hypothetical protein